MHPFQTRWWNQRKFVGYYNGPKTMKDLEDYWAEHDQYELLFHERREHEGKKPKTLYSKVMKQLRKKHRREREDQLHSVLLDLFSEEEEESYRRILNILRLPEPEEGATELPSFSFSVDQIQFEEEPAEFPAQIFDITRPISEQIFQSTSELPILNLRNLLPVRDRMVGDYFTLNFQLPEIIFPEEEDDEL